MLKELITLSNKISKDSLSWIMQFEIFAPAVIARLRQKKYNSKNIIKILLSLLKKPNFDDVQEIFIFQGLRNKDYISLFRPESVVIVGSHLERAYSTSHGYRFCASYPIESAIHAKIFIGFNLPIILQVKYWLGALSNKKRIVFFLYEDTQPLGVFFVHLGRILRPEAISVCIQHGMFYSMKYPIRVDGELSDVNFVWDYNQVKIINCNKSKAFEIGLPYVANAVPTNNLKIVFIGTGNMNIGNNNYENTINVYHKIYKILKNNINLKFSYRPHPNEWIEEDTILALRNNFPHIDNSDKRCLLNGPRTIFIGTISSIMYEAGIAGHLVVRLIIDEEQTCEVDCDFSFNSLEINNLIEWITKKNHNQYSKIPKNLNINNNNILSPRKRFVKALYSAKIIKEKSSFLININ